MPYEVRWLFSSCSQLHGSHSRLEDAADCFLDLTHRFGREIPVHPISGKYIYAIVALDEDGNQKEFSDADKNGARQLKLDSRSLIEKFPGITTFLHLSQLYYEAVRWIPISAFNLRDIFEPENKDRMFWSSDAGLGQALAFAHQAIFTVELSLKALLNQYQGEKRRGMK